MPRNGVSNDTLDGIEDRLAEILNGRHAVFWLERNVREMHQRGHIDDEEAARLIADLDIIVIALRRGQWFGQRVRRHPNIIGGT